MGMHHFTQFNRFLPNARLDSSGVSELLRNYFMILHLVDGFKPVKAKSILSIQQPWPSKITHFIHAFDWTSNVHSRFWSTCRTYERDDYTKQLFYHHCREWNWILTRTHEVLSHVGSTCYVHDHAKDGWRRLALVGHYCWFF